MYKSLLILLNMVLLISCSKPEGWSFHPIQENEKLDFLLNWGNSRFDNTISFLRSEKSEEFLVINTQTNMMTASQIKENIINNIRVCF